MTYHDDEQSPSDSPPDEIMAIPALPKEDEVRTSEESPSGYMSQSQSTKPSSSPGSTLLFGALLALFFAAGLTLGFFGRPVIVEDLPVAVAVTVEPAQVEVVVTATPNPNQSLAGINSDIIASETTEAVSSDNSDSANNETTDAPEATAGDGSATPTLMEFLLADARHIQGDPEAPVTLIEFSDFK